MNIEDGNVYEMLSDHEFTSYLQKTIEAIMKQLFSDSGLTTVRKDCGKRQHIVTITGAITENKVPSRTRQ